tara:strand:- start:70 stop:303 length:234 start_codon:yes stop_codon:yes gene_type:complete
MLFFGGVGQFKVFFTQLCRQCVEHAISVLYEVFEGDQYSRHDAVDCEGLVKVMLKVFNQVDECLALLFRQWDVRSEI